MADALRPGQHRIVQLHRIQIKVTFHILEPLHRIACGRLQTQHLEAAGGFVFLERGFQIGIIRDMFGQGYRRFQRQLGARANGKMRSCRGIPKQHHILVAPFFAQHAGEVDPGRATDVIGVGHQRMAAQMSLEHLLKDRNGFLLIHVREPKVVIGFLRALHEERRGVIVKLIGVHPDPAFVGFLEYEGEGVVKFLMGAKPDKGAFSHVYVGLEAILEFQPGFGVQTVTGHHQIIVIHIGRCGLHFRFKLQVHAQFPRAVLQDHQQAVAPDAAKSVTRRRDRLALVDQCNVIPICEMAANFLGRHRIVDLKIVQRFIRQNHAPTKSIIRLVTLQQGHISIGLTQLEGDRKVETRRSPAQTNRAHRFSLL